MLFQEATFPVDVFKLMGEAWVTKFFFSEGEEGIYVTDIKGEGLSQARFWC